MDILFVARTYYVIFSFMKANDMEKTTSRTLIRNFYYIVVSSITSTGDTTTFVMCYLQIWKIMLMNLW